MGYKALYRVFRPKTFGEVVGQKHILTVLKNQVISGQISHAYLFTGSRGTGKTSVAKIFARTISCPNSVDGEACLNCVLCKDTLQDNSIDIIEIDAASNNGVDEIRELRDNVKYAPTNGKYKVYIIDEVHMLSSSAFNALLKTLEEPPAHAVFILATTEPQKLPETIVSRCQRYDFEKIDDKDIVDRLQNICNEVGASADTDALYMIATFAKGGLRDAISLLDQCIVFGENKVTKDNVLDLLGKNSDTTLFEIADMLISGKGYECISYVNRICEDGKNISILTGEVVDHLRDLLFCKFAGKNDIANMGEMKIAQSKKANEHMLIRSVKLLSEAIMNMKYAFNPIVLFEVAVMEIVTPEISEDNFALLERITKLEEKLADLEKNGVTKVVEVQKQVAKTVAKPVVPKIEDSKPMNEIPEYDFGIPDIAPPADDEPQFYGDVAPWEEPVSKQDKDIAPWEDEDNDVAPWEDEKEEENDIAPWEEASEEQVPAIKEETVEEEVEEVTETVKATGKEDFTEKDYKELMALLNKENKGVAITLKLSFFGGATKDTIDICFPDEKCAIFMKAVESKKDIIISAIQKMGFNQSKICVKIGSIDKEKAVIDIFGKDNVTFID